MEINNCNKKACDLIQSNFEYFFEIMSKSVINTEQFKCTMSPVPHPYYNSVIKTQLKTGDIDSTILNMKIRYKNEKQGHCWWYNELTQPQDLTNYLIKHNYKFTECFYGLSYDLTNYEIKDLNHNDYMIVQLTEVEQLTYWIYPFLEHNHYKNLMGRKIYERYTELFKTEKGLMHLVVFYKQQPVGCGSLLLTDNCAGLYNVGLINDTNKDKVIELLKTARLNLAKKNNCKTIVLQLPEAIHRKGFYNDFEENMIFETYIY